MHEPDQEKTSVVTERGLYCYQVMPFGLKNAGATYQRLVNKMFAPLIGWNMEVYVDDMLVKSRLSTQHENDLAEAFNILRKYHMKLNPDKCTFGFRALTDELFLYLAVSETAVSSALVKEENGRQVPVYYTSKALVDVETRYPSIEKMALALIVAARRLRPYFQAHAIHVLTNLPLKQVLQKPETSGRLMKWAVELGEYDIRYKPRTAVKGQAIADFIADLTPGLIPQSEDIPLGTHDGHSADPELWTIYVDGSSNGQGCGAGVVLLSPSKECMEVALRFGFKTSNKEAEYEALIAGLQVARGQGAKHLLVHSDSMYNQVSGEYQVKGERLSAYKKQVQQLLAEFPKWEIQQISRSENRNADALSQLATAYQTNVGRTIPVTFVPQSSTEKTLVVYAMNVPGHDSWMCSIIKYLNT
ncbi:uncharacterized protein LOC111012821 [Momordica charantia]|uniref:Uncharacterized protein LOC111012821 n=1 Tax=Momordica charantia TaxID=3673 RepID=A0A6J1CP54_MOMCH|nr:uncharacterized protein LOC111012821 [Momordica charantia]